MAITEEGSSPFYMPVAPAYQGGAGGFGNGFGGFGGDGWWIILLFLLLIGNNGWGNNGANGGGLYPWMNQAEVTTGGFRDQMLNTGISGVRDSIGNLSTQLCNCCCDMRQEVAGGFAAAEQAANARQIANLQQAFAAQTAVTGGSYRRGGSYARGGNRRGMVTNPTGRNQYSRDGGYSRAEGDMAEIVEELRGMMDDLPEEKQREVQRFVEKVERM